MKKFFSEVAFPVCLDSDFLWGERFFFFTHPWRAAISSGSDMAAISSGMGSYACCSRGDNCAYKAKQIGRFATASVS